MAKPKAKTKNKVDESLPTEEKIKNAARIVFSKKGYAATRTRDIAEEAGMNLALLNYYFRSKEKLFELIMMEKMAMFFGTIAPLLNDTSLSLEQKFASIVERYIQLLTDNPDLPIFILSEIRSNPDRFVNKLPVSRLFESHFAKQLAERRPDLHPVHTFLNLLGLTIFPFVMKPVLVMAGVTTAPGFMERMEERKALIPKWISMILDKA